MQGLANPSIFSGNGHFVLAFIGLVWSFPMSQKGGAKKYKEYIASAEF